MNKEKTEMIEETRMQEMIDDLINHINQGRLKREFHDFVPQSDGEKEYQQVINGTLEEVESGEIKEISFEKMIELLNGWSGDNGFTIENDIKCGLFKEGTSEFIYYKSLNSKLEEVFRYLYGFYDSMAVKYLDGSIILYATGIMAGYTHCYMKLSQVKK